jgi:hypothetical protein
MQIDGNGIRDHSWGPRYWSQTVSYRFINGSFGDSLGFTVSAVANGRGHGALQIGERMVRVTSAKVQSWYTNDDTADGWEGTERPGGQGEWIW